jgi:hypothetical protein
VASRCLCNARAGACTELQCAPGVILPLHHLQASSPGWTRSCRVVWRPTSRRAPPRRTWARARWARSAKPAGVPRTSAQQAAQRSCGDACLQLQHARQCCTLQSRRRSLTCSAPAPQPQDADLPDPDAQSHIPGLRLQPAACASLPQGGQRQSHRGDGGQCTAGGVTGEATWRDTPFKSLFSVQPSLEFAVLSACITLSGFVLTVHTDMGQHARLQRLLLCRLTVERHG